MGLLSDKTCVITGGYGSVGMAAASLFLDEGARVLLVGRNAEALAAAADGLAAGGNGRPAAKGRVASVQADVGEVADTQRYVADAVERWGSIDVLFSHAGISGVIKPVVEYPEDVFDAVMRTNVRGSFLACKYALPHMNDGGSIVITSSIMGVTADPGVAAYATSKHALIGLARVVAKEAAGRNIRVNVLAPGPIANEFQTTIEERLTDILGQDGTQFLNGVIPLGRHSHPDEVARMALFLASDQSSFSTGGVFMCDGGMGI
jgi:NAD(P)-dependent dehydrogenase (short-subunit alcohol dehydrogenase family)